MLMKRPTFLGKARVTFTMPAAIRATTFYVVGDFNGWNATATPLNKSEQGWSVSIDLEVGRSYQYRYLVDGRWFNDWNADDYEPNEHGGDNSVVNVPSYEALHGETNYRYEPHHGLAVGVSAPSM